MKLEESQCGKFKDRLCPNCKETLRYNEAGHFVPPSLNEQGFYICQEKKESQADGSQH